MDHPLLSATWRQLKETSPALSKAHFGDAFVEALLPCYAARSGGGATETIDPFLAHFSPVGWLGRGSFGDVLLVQLRADPQLFFAAKKLPLDDGHDSSEWGVALECATDSNSDGEGRYLLRYLCQCRAPDGYYLITELAPHGTLQDAHRATLFNSHPWRVLRLLAQALCGLSLLHARCILHRDIKPANLLLCSDETVPSSGAMADDHIDRDMQPCLEMERLCIGDFGISKLCRREDVCRASSDPQGANAPATLSSSSSQHHTVIGTLAYAAPEVIEHWGTSATAPYGAPADVFALGAVFYCWLARDDLCGGLIRGPHDATLLLQGLLPKLEDLHRHYNAQCADPRHGSGEVGAPKDLLPLQSSATISLSASQVQRRQEEVWYAEGRRLQSFPMEMLRCVDSMMAVNPNTRPSASDALSRLRRMRAEHEEDNAVEWWCRPFYSLVASDIHKGMSTKSCCWFSGHLPLAAGWSVALGGDRNGGVTLWVFTSNGAHVAQRSGGIPGGRGVLWVDCVRQVLCGHGVDHAGGSRPLADVCCVVDKREGDLAHECSCATRREVVIAHRRPPFSITALLDTTAAAAFLYMSTMCG